MQSTTRSAPFFMGRIRSVDGHEEVFDAWPDQTLLDNLEQGGLQWPSSCRNGSCRTCIGTLQQGEVRYAIEWPGLSAEEKAQGCVLPCVAYPTGDVTLGEPFEG